MSKRRNNLIVANAAANTDPLKKRHVRKEQARLMLLFDGADGNKMDFIRDTVNQLAWLGVTIQELQVQIDAKGVVLPYQNGENQSGYQVNPACKLLKDYQQVYNTQFRALLPLVPEKPSDYDSLDEFRIEPLTPEEVAADEEREK